MSPRAARACAAGALALLAFACFAPALDYDFLVTSDDWDYVLANPAVRAGLSLSGLRWALSAHAANWHPLTWLSHMADVELFGMNPAGHHLTSLVLHAANAALLFLVLVDMTGRAGRSLLVAALFAVHPTRIESVAWVAERKDVLCAFFWILATGAYVRATRSSGRWRFAPALVLFALGLAAKPMIVTLPVLLLLLDAGPLGRLASPRRDLPGLLREKRPFFALAAASAVVTVIAQHAGFAVQSLDAFPLGVRLGHVPLAYASYLRVLVWPRDLSAFYRHPGPELPWAAAAASLALLAALSVLAVRSRRCFLHTGWLFFLVSLLPVIGIVQVGEQARADRYTYVPFVGLWVALVWAGAGLLGRARASKALAVAAGGLLVALALAATRVELPYWRDARTLFGRAVELDPANVFARQNLGVALLYAGDAGAARAQFDETLRRRPDYPYALRAGAEAAVQAGDPAAAVAYLERLVRALPEDRAAVVRLAGLRAAGHRSIAADLRRQGRASEALAHEEAAARLDPSGR